MYTDCGTGSVCAHTDSMRRQNSAVTVNSMINDGVNDWEDADMVFFYGHNAMIKPQWSHSGFERWQPHYNGDIVDGWCRTSSDWINWGTSSDPYYYHRYWQTNASLANPYVVFYAYNPITSVLPGKDYSTTGNWQTENTWSGGSTTHSGKLDGDTEWIIAHGCQAVTVAKAQNNDWGPTPDPIVSSALGVNAWKKTWDNLHMVLGHYYETSTACEPPLGDNGTSPNPYDFASLLKAGDDIKDAYFDIHDSDPHHNGTACNSTSYPARYQPAAIAKSPTSCCSMVNLGNYSIMVCPPSGCAGDYMNDETWTAPMADLTGSSYYATSWREAE